MVATRKVWLPSAKYGCHPQSMVATRKVWLPSAKYGCHPQSMVATRKVWLPPAKYNLPPAKYNLPPAKCNLPPAKYPCQTVNFYSHWFLQIPKSSPSIKNSALWFLLILRDLLKNKLYGFKLDLMEENR